MSTKTKKVVEILRDYYKVLCYKSYVTIYIVATSSFFLYAHFFVKLVDFYAMLFIPYSPT